MALVVLFSTLSFTVESHYCGENLIDTAIFTKAKWCGGDVTDKTTVLKSCCKNKVEVIKGQDQLKLNNFDDLDGNTQLLLTAYFSSFQALFTTLAKQIIPHSSYAPPTLIYDIHVLDETFLI